MSQVTPTPNTPPASNPLSMSSAFSTPPVHPYRSTPPAPAVQQPATPPAPAPRGGVQPAPVTPVQAPQFTGTQSSVPQPAVSTMPPVQPPATAVPQPPVQNTPVPPANPAPQFDATRFAYERMQQLEAERNQIAQRLQQQEQNYAALQAQFNEQQQARQLQEQYNSLTASINRELGEKLQSVDEADAYQIVDATLAAATPMLNEMRNRMDALQRSIDSKFQQQQALAFQQQQAATREAVLRAHPDFYQLALDPAYQAYMREKDGLSSRTRDDAALAEFQAGNAAYIIELLNQYKNRGAAVTAPVGTVPPIETATAYSAPVPQINSQQQTDDQAELLRLIQTHAISPDEFKARLDKLRSTPV